MSTNDKPKDNVFTVDEILKQANALIPEQPKVIAKEAKSTDFQDGVSFMASDGRMMYKYHGPDGETVVLPKPVEQMSEQDFYDLPIALYDNSPGRIPNNMTVVFKDPQWSGHWFNKSAKNGLRVGVARSLGFVPALKDDLVSYNFAHDDSSGSVEQGDLVLMKIHKAKLYLRFKEFMDKAKREGGIQGYMNKANSELNPANRGADPYFHTKQALQEFQGLGPVAPLPTT